MATQQTIITMFPTITSVFNPEHCALLEVLEAIRSRINPFKSIVQEINKADHSRANNLKLALPPICFSGKFSKRDDTGLIQYSQLVCIDVDEVSDVTALKKEMKDVPFVYSCFLSPSGKGLKILVIHDCPDKAKHSDIYHYIGEQLGLTTRSDLKFDTHCSNLSRACFFSYDPKLIMNQNAETMKIEAIKLKPHSKSSSAYSPHDSLPPITAIQIPSDYKDLKKLKESLIMEIEEFERFNSFYPGVRNRNLNILVCKLRSKGYPEELVLPYLQLYYGGKHPDFTIKEIGNCIKSVYNFRP
ncbi:MAG: hypothetical protein HDS57_01520 [Barnesiella sp.]|nr:hypothetical protein [Barnesiella sp.]